MITKWKVSKWKSAIEQVECTKETKSSVWVKEKVWTLRDGPDKYEVNRHPRVTRYDIYFDSWDEAYAYTLEKAKGRVEYLERELKSAKNVLDTILHSLIRKKPTVI